MSYHRSFNRAVVCRELEATLRAGRQRILELGGDCDPLKRMVRDGMHMLDQAQARATKDTSK